MELYRARVGEDVDEKERLKLLFLELEKLEIEVKNKSVKTSFKSTIFWWINTILNLTVIISSAVIVIVTAIYNFQNITAIVLGGIIFAISGINGLMHLGERGYDYSKGTFRLRRIRGQIRDMLYMFQNYTAEQILTIISNFRTEVDEIDLNLYEASMVGEAKFGNGLRIIENSNQNLGTTPIRYKNSINEIDNSHIHIHIDSPSNSPGNTPNHTPSHTPTDSPNNSPRSLRKISIDYVEKHSDPKLHSSPREEGKTEIEIDDVIV